jgi:hypothetical protein
LRELRSFLDLAAIALHVLSLNSDHNGDGVSSAGMDVKVPRMFFQIQQLSCCELRLAYSYLADAGSFASQSRSQQNSQAQRQQKQCELTFITSLDVNEPKKHSLRFRPDEFPQKVYFEERLNRNLVEGAKRVLLEVYRCHRGVNQIVYFRKLVRSCSERFDIFLTVELIPRSDNEIRCVYRGSDHHSLFSTTIRMIHPNVFICGDTAHTESVSERLFYDLRVWYLKCGDSERNPRIFLPLVPRLADNGISFTENQFNLAFNDSCVLDQEERKLMGDFFSISVNCPPYHRTRLVNFAKVIYSPLHVLREMLRLFHMELETANVVQHAAAPQIGIAAIDEGIDLLKIRNCLTCEPPMDWHYDSSENVVYVVVEFFENLQRMSSKIRSLGMPRLFLPLRYSFTERSLCIWRAGEQNRRILINSPKLTSQLVRWDRISLATALRLLRTKSMAEIGSLAQL